MEQITEHRVHNFIHFPARTQKMAMVPWHVREVEKLASVPIEEKIDTPFEQ